MKKLNLFSIIILMLIYVDSNAQQSVKDFELKGNVKSVKSIGTFTKEINGKSRIVPPYKISELKFNKKGVLTEDIEYHYDGSIIHIFKYDDEGRALRKVYFDDNKSLSEIDIFYYGNKNIIEENRYKGNGDLRIKVLKTYNDKGEELEDAGYFSNGKLYRKWIYKYDNNGNKIETKSYSPEEGLIFKAFYKYDNKGNEVEYKVYSPKNILWNKTVKEYNSNNQLIKNTEYVRGKLHFTAYYKYDNKGREIEYTKYYPKSGLDDKTTHKYSKNRLELYNYSPHKGIENTFVYKEIAFDKQGNWIKRLSHEIKDSTDYYIKERQIEYYK